MDRTRHQLSPGLWLDARRAVWLEKEGVLAVADLHLGYAWAQRAAGNLVPLSAGEDAPLRLRALVEDYAPREVAVLGDIVHRALRLEGIHDALRSLVDAVGDRARLRLVAGNHDRQLDILLEQFRLPLQVETQLAIGPHRLLHGDRADEAQAAALLAEAAQEKGRVLFGHEHPAITLSDRAATALKCPCFLVAPDALVLPAFSSWAAGSDVRRGDFMSPLARQAKWRGAVAILAGKLLPVPISR